MIKEALVKLVNRQDLAEEEMELVMTEIMEGKATDAQIASLLTALRMKGETVKEVSGAARVMRRKALRIDARSSVVVDTCGTGGDNRGTFNISTTAAFVVAAAGITVAKHGNRAVSSGCGSADLLEALGVNIEATPDVVEECIQQVGIGFLFAPRLHGAMKYALGPRREMGFRTIFNMLGPLTNPASATAQLVGVYAPELTEMFAHVLRNLGVKRAFVVHGSDGLDEATVTGETRVSELREGVVTTYNIDPIRYFGEYYSLEELRGGDAYTNAEITKSILAGEDGAKRKIVILNAGLAIVAAGRASTLEEGIKIAEERIDDGSALRKLRELIDVSNS
ncbi:MAG: anthranilate phosphoribosyltransferase [Syntrophales bacterium]|nr:anthranilate phosphoribosyltransferase [Syntrophales bacterium]